MRWSKKPGVTIEQAAYFPTDPKLTGSITVRVSPPKTRGGVDTQGRGLNASANGSPPTSPSATSTFILNIRVPSWLRLPGSAHINGAPTGVPPVLPGTFLSLKRTWSDGDVVDFSFPPSLWTAPLNDKHAWHNATVAFMYGPLVLAGVDVTSDIFVPSGRATEPGTFIRRNSSKRLEFEAVSATGEKMKVRGARSIPYFHKPLVFRSFRTSHVSLLCLPPYNPRSSMRVLPSVSSSRCVKSWRRRTSSTSTLPAASRRSLPFITARILWVPRVGSRGAVAIITTHMAASAATTV